jgi:hypothetical protein
VEKWVNYLKNMPPPPRLAPILNKRIDELLHPLGERNKSIYIVDAVAHALVEQADSLVLSLYKSIRYNLPKILRGESCEKPTA